MFTPKQYPGRRHARDEETTDYTAVLAFLRERLDAEDLTKVAGMLGVEVETTGMDRRRSVFTFDAAAFPHAGRLK